MCSPFDRRQFLAAAGATAAGLWLPTGFSDLVHADGMSPPARYGYAVSKLTQRRLVDTRRALDVATVNANVSDRVIELDVDAEAVALTVTLVGGGDAGFAVAYAADDSVPETSMVNVTGRQTRANTSIVKTSNGKIRVFRSVSSLDVIVDLIAVLTSQPAGGEGRIRVLPQTQRIVDTRDGSPVAPNETVAITRPSTVPGDAIAVLVNLTATQTTGPGFLTAFRSSVSEPPLTSCLNCDAAEQSRGALTMVPLSGSGFNVFVGAMGCDLIVDIVGYVTGPREPWTDHGFFLPAHRSIRLFDSRSSEPMAAGATRELFTQSPIQNLPAAGALCNLTATRALGPGFVSGSAAGDGQPPTSNLNYAPGETIANAAIVPVSERGIEMYSHAETHLIVDVFGWITGVPAPAQRAARSEPYGLQQRYLEDVADEWFDLGRTEQGRPMRVFRVGSGRKVATIVSHVHGDEWTGESIITEMAHRFRPSGWTLMLIPAASPDARAANQRYVRSVDLNRDFPVDWERNSVPTSAGCAVSETGAAPLSTPEARVLSHAFTVGALRTSQVVISHHDNYNWVSPQSGSPAWTREAASAYAATAGLRLPGEAPRWPESPAYTHVPGGFETFVASLGKQAFLVENKAGWQGACHHNTFGVHPVAADIEPHLAATNDLLEHF